MASALKTSQSVTTPREFFVSERKRFYKDWMLSFWRELFQNSVDAGAGNIRIRVEEVNESARPGEASPPKVTRVVFSDDGGGMTEKVLDDVYFSIGKTTKTGGDSVGGFGRARLMTCFSHVRYGVYTQDRVVEGTGGNYGHFHVSEATQAYYDEAENAAEAGRVAERQSDYGLSLFETERARSLRAKADALRDGPQFRKGCELEIDIDAAEGDWDHPTARRMTEKLYRYLAESDVKPDVFVNDEKHEPQKLKMTGKRELFATMESEAVPAAWKSSKKVKIVERPDGKVDVAFGRVMMADTKKQPHVADKELVVRVNGASMFTRGHGAKGIALFLEVNPAIAREVLTSNRDGLMPAFDTAVNDFCRMMATDSIAALKPQEGHEFNVVPGGKGRKLAQHVDISAEASLSEDVQLTRSERETQQRLASRASSALRSINYDGDEYDWNNFKKNTFRDLNTALILKFFQQVRKAESTDETFLKNFSDQEKVKAFKAALERGGENSALAAASGQLLGFIADNMTYREFIATMEEREKLKDVMGDFHDVPVYRDAFNPPDGILSEKEAKERWSKIVAAVRRYDPRNWDPETGKGLQPRKVLAAWQAVVDNVVEMSMKARPALKPFSYASGWYFGHPNWVYDSLKGESGWQTTAAALRTDKVGDDDGVRFFLLNPLDDDFKIKFNPMDPDDRDRMIAIGIHEASHIITDSHSDQFAYMMSDLTGELIGKVRAKIHRDIIASVKSVQTIYGEGRTRSAPMDDQKGPRPAERLLNGMGSALDEAMERREDGGFEVEASSLDDAQFTAASRYSEIEEADIAYAPSNGM